MDNGDITKILTPPQRKYNIQDPVQGAKLLFHCYLILQMF